MKISKNLPQVEKTKLEYMPQKFQVLHSSWGLKFKLSQIFIFLIPFKKVCGNGGEKGFWITRFEFFIINLQMATSGQLLFKACLQFVWGNLRLLAYLPPN